MDVSSVTTEDFKVVFYFLPLCFLYRFKVSDVYGESNRVFVHRRSNGTGADGSDGQRVRRNDTGPPSGVHASATSGDRATASIAAGQPRVHQLSRRQQWFFRASAAAKRRPRVVIASDGYETKCRRNSLRTSHFARTACSSCLLSLHRGYLACACTYVFKRVLVRNYLLTLSNNERIVFSLIKNLYQARTEPASFLF